MLLEKIVQEIVNPTIYLLMGVALIVFFWGVAQFIRASDDPTAKSEGQKHLLWGIIGLAIMFGVFGIMNLIQGTLESLV